MSTRTFSKVSPAIWRPGRFMALASTEAKLLYIYFITNEHINSAGCYRLPDGYACADLGWTAETYQAERQRLVEAELIDFDDDVSAVYIERWFKHNPPMNNKHRTGTERIIERIESDRLREKAEADFMAVIEPAENVHPFDTKADPLDNRLTGTRFMTGRR